MDTVALIIDGVIAVLCIICMVYLYLSFRITQAKGLGWLMAGFAYSAVLRLIIMFDNPARVWSREIILPSFVCFTVGAILLYRSLRDYYRQ